MSDVLFEIKPEHLETGLRGFPVGYCTTSTVDPTLGLFYVGRSIEELAAWEPEAVIYLLYHGTAGNDQEIKQFRERLCEKAKCLPETLASICQLPRSGHPMKIFCAALLILGMLEGENDYKKDCFNLIAKLPEVVAAVINHHAGWKSSAITKPELGYIENFVHLLGLPNKDTATLTKVFKLFDVLHFDHGGGNLSTFVGKAVASGLEDLYGSMSAAMCALAGPRHGKANQDCLDFTKSILQSLSENASEEDVERLIRSRLANQELIFGFGHAVLRVEDPRATVLYKVAHDMYPNDSLCRIALLLRGVGPKVLGENPKISNPFPNVDAISGALLSAAGFDYPEYFTLLFGMSRCVGIARQIVYERCEAREGKGTPIVRPKYFFKNPKEV